MSDLLIIGGSQFVGRAIVDAALERGHRLTVFNRGVTNTDLPHEVEQLRGDRRSDLGVLAGRRWDAVIDVCGYEPGVVRASLEALANAVGHYTFVSSVSVYADLATPGIDETRPLLQPEPGDDVSAMQPATHYGVLKALCEAEVEKVMPSRSLIVRPGLIVGRRDHTQRYGRWVARIGEGGDVLAPGRPDAPVQVIDVRDLAAWLVRATEERLQGAFNAVGPADRVTMGELFEGIGQALGSDARLTWVDDAFLKANLPEGAYLPLWTEAAMPAYARLFEVDASRARKAGLTHRLLEDTARDTARWQDTLPANHAWRTGLTGEQEAALLAAWAARAPSGT